MYIKHLHMYIHGTVVKDYACCVRTYVAMYFNKNSVGLKNVSIIMVIGQGNH